MFDNISTIIDLIVLAYAITYFNTNNKTLRYFLFYKTSRKRAKNVLKLFTRPPQKPTKLASRLNYNFTKKTMQNIYFLNVEHFIR